MFLSNLATLDRDAPTLPLNVQKGLKFIAETDIAALPAGRVDIEGDTIFALIQDYDTAPKAEKRPESHARYTDIQFVFSGREVIGYAPLALDHTVEEDLIEAKDIKFYSKVTDETDLVLGAGAYTVFYPTDIHRPGCAAGAPGKVRKVVIKLIV